ncbi:hypothetical protein [Legionella maioricensis]|uniref:Uncharacterized protein n=1 Tax=Legionella maioricensis TaxID=2896528 RepID=A0A9X2D2F5_9GAMM|nr:hypothetical protein [Legionella maioricensis]MCL9685079.1 hypothetical protein [Legionella maioricensis]MCL9688160.1 hypothetical protein [Legionella maioricensis]
MRDCYGRKFKKENIKNKNAIGFVELKSIEEFSTEELRRNAVLITDHKNGDKLYLLSDLQEILKANNYCRLEDPLTRLDILDQVPDFQVAIEFEQQAAHYNASILDKNPEFIPLLKTYVTEVLHIADERAFRDTAKDDIRANRSEELDRFYTAIANFSEEERNAFYSLFLTNRRPYNQGHLWSFPAKWDLDTNNPIESNIYRYAISHKQYTPYSHRNVLVGDFIRDPEDACMHSWGMDVLHLLLEYHIGTNRPFSLFDETNPGSLAMEQELRRRIEQVLVPGSLNAQKGQEAYEKVKHVVNSTISNPEPEEQEEYIPHPKVLKLEQACTKYMDYILSKLDIETDGNYPLPDELDTNNAPLIAKYRAVYEMYSLLSENDPDVDNDERLTKFTELYNQEARRTTIAAHRDGVGIRFLNIVFSLLTCGVKNLITYYATEGYCGFWNSRGANLNKDIATILENTPTQASLS